VAESIEVTKEPKTEEERVVDSIDITEEVNAEEEQVVETNRSHWRS
jgi:hypothetical protein